MINISTIKKIISLIRVSVIARIIEAPASPHTTRAGGADREGHPGRVKARGGGRRAEEGMGAGVHWHLTAKGAKTAKDPTALALRPLRSLRCSIS